MEENLLNELENFSSVKYLENVTNNSGANGFCSDDDQVRNSLSFKNIFIRHFSFCFVRFIQGQFPFSAIGYKRSSIDLSGEMWKSFAGTERRTRTSNGNSQSRFPKSNRCKNEKISKTFSLLNKRTVERIHLWRHLNKNVTNCVFFSNKFKLNGKQKPTKWTKTKHFYVDNSKSFVANKESTTKNNVP